MKKALILFLAVLCLIIAVELGVLIGTSIPKHQGQAQKENKEIIPYCVKANIASLNDQQFIGKTAESLIQRKSGLIKDIIQTVIWEGEITDISINRPTLFCDAEKICDEIMFSLLIQLSDKDQSNKEFPVGFQNGEESKAAFYFKDANQNEFFEIDPKIMTNYLKIGDQVNITSYLKVQNIKPYEYRIEKI